VRLDIADRSRIDPGCAARLLDEIGLSRRIGYRQPRRAATVIGRRALYDSMDSVAVVHRAVQRLQQHHDRAFTADISVRSFVEGLAFAVRRQHSRFVVSDAVRRMAHDIDAGDQRLAALPGIDGPDGFMQRDQRTGTRTVDLDARPGQVVKVGKPIGQDRHRSRKAKMTIDLVSLFLG
jgi:hypothetical protein